MAYDYIIAGAGSAGATLAARLTEDPACSVLLLEAGLDYRTAERPRELAIPNPGAALYRQEQIDTYLWPNLEARRTEVQKPRLFWRGRGIGGSSSINGQIAIRALPEDHDRWQELGCAGWSAADLLPAYMKLEDDLDFGDRPYHGRGGPIPIYRAPLERWGGTDRALREAALALGYGSAEDHNAPTGSGVSPYAINSRDGVRISVNEAYLEPVRERANLTIVGEAPVDRVEFVGRRATGVRARLNGDWQSIAAEEVILSAGAVHTPAILQRSGIGPAGDLRRLQIEPWLDLPVGRNLLDHPAITVRLDLTPGARVPTLDHRHTNCCVRYSSGLEGAGRNDMIVIAFNIQGYDEPGRAIGRYLVSAFQAWSQGRVLIASSDPLIDPQVDECMLSDTRDLVRMRDGVRRLFDLARQPATAAIAERITAGITGRPIEEFESDAAVDAWLLAEASDAQHASGTCRMGSSSDSRTVVTPDCRVLDTERLRVIDASIMPEVPRANTHLATVAIAELMAERLRAG